MAGALLRIISSPVRFQQASHIYLDKGQEVDAFYEASGKAKIITCVTANQFLIISIYFIDLIV